MSEESRDLFTVPEAAKKLGKKPMTLYRWIKADKLTAVIVGGMPFVPGSEIRRLAKLQKAAPV